MKISMHTQVMSNYSNSGRLIDYYDNEGKFINDSDNADGNCDGRNIKYNRDDNYEDEQQYTTHNQGQNILIGITKPALAIIINS